MQIIKAQINDSVVVVQYEIGGNVYQITSPESPHMDFISSITSLTHAFAERTLLGNIPDTMLRVFGVVFGIDSEGQFIKLLGIYVANGIEYKLTTPKIYRVDEKTLRQIQRLDDFEEIDYKTFPRYTWGDEVALLEKVEEEAQLFVNGKRRPELQKTFNFGEIDDLDVDLSEEDEEAEGW